jgi:hypothetical protein
MLCPALNAEGDTTRFDTTLQYVFATHAPGLD